jgi:hypothetical protein
MKNVEVRVNGGVASAWFDYECGEDRRSATAA